MKKIILTFLALAYLVSAFAQQRTVLIEQITNASCSICAGSNPQLFNYTDQNEDKVVVISYHASFPYAHDSLHHANPTDNTARTSYYSANGTPTTVIDGNYFQGSTGSLLSTLNTRVTQRAAQAAQYTVEVKNLKLENGQIKGDANYTSIGDNSAANLRAFVVLVEKNVYRTSYKASPGSNSENHYQNVMRYIFGATTEQSITSKTNGAVFTTNFTFNTQNIKSLNEVRVVAFVQNTTTKEIYQAAYKDLNATTTGVDQPDENNFTWSYNNLARQYLLNLNQPTETGQIIITDITGRQVAQQNFTGNTTTVDVATLSTGIYLATVSTGTASYTTKIWVQ